MSRLLLVRHGKTRLHKDDRFWGATDVALSDTGIRQAESLRNRLAGEVIHAVYTSTLNRARLTAEIVNSDSGRKINGFPELNECNFGYVEGLTFGEIGHHYPELAQALRGADTAVQFPGGESFAELDGRVRKFMPELEKHKPEETVLIVGHASPLRILVCYLLGIGVKHWRQFRLDLASLSIIYSYPGGGIISLLNDTSHLEPEEEEA